MTTQAPIDAALVLEKAERELELQILGIQELEDGLKQAEIDGTKEWESSSWWQKSLLGYWSWCDSAERWARQAKDEYLWKHDKEWRRRETSKRCAEGLIKLASATQGKVMLSSDDANFLNINEY